VVKLSYGIGEYNNLYYDRPMMEHIGSQQKQFLVGAIHELPLHVTSFTGQELLSSPFHFNVTFIADSAQINAEDLLGKNITIQINDNKKPRIFNGIISTCKLGGITADQLRECNCVLVPWFWFLQYDSDCRIFQDKTVIEIFKMLCQEKGFRDYDLNNLKGNYKPIPYCVQYNESTFDFLKRILAKAGIYYYFIYQENKHTMMLVDQTTIPKQFSDGVVYSNSRLHKAHVHEWLAYNKLPAEQSILGQGNYSDFRPGLNFKLNQHPDNAQNSKYFLMSVEHSASEQTYINKFTCMSATQKYQPDILPKPRIGTQTAIVSGPKQNEIYTDKLGRLKVRFHWNNTTCWIKVSQQLADSKWGFQFIPRVGSEVIVDFINKDPDRPIITGSLHNAEQLPPYAYPIEESKTGIKTRSNEIQFNDAKEAEELNIHANKDYENAVNKVMTVNINKNHTEKIIGNRTIYTAKDHTIVINEKVNIAGGTGEITMNPDSITLQAPKISLGNKASGAVSKAQEQNLYPSAEVKINGWESTLPPNKILFQGSLYIITSSNSLHASLKTYNKKSVNPVTFDKEGFKVEAKNETAKIFSELKIKNPEAILAEQPILTLSNGYGEYNFALTANLITENEQQYTGTLSKDEFINDDDWIINGAVNMNLTVTLSKDQKQGFLPKTLVYDIEHDLARVRSALTSLLKNTELALQNAPPPEAAIIIVGVSLLAIAAAPVGV
jgi:uncharacterized protein involved in type VI secretion and phage assembly